MILKMIEVFVGFPERYNLKIMDTFFYIKESKKWTWKSSNNETRSEIDFILTNKLNTVKNITFLF